VRELQAGFSLETRESAEDAPLEDEASELVATPEDVEEVVFGDLGIVASGVKYQVGDFVTIWPPGPVWQHQIFALCLESSTWGQCNKTNTAAIYCHFILNYHRNIYNIEFTLE